MARDKQKKLRVGILAYDLREPRGGTKLAISLGTQLQKAGCEVAYSCVYEKIKDMKEFFGEKYDFIIYKPKSLLPPKEKIFHYAALWTHRDPTLRLIKEFKPDVIIEIGGIITSLFPAIQKKIPTIYYCIVPVSSYSYQNKYKLNLLVKSQLNLFKYVEKYFVKRINKVIAMSKFTQKDIKKLWQVSPQIIYPPIDTKLFKHTKKEKVILSVCRYDPVFQLEKVIEMYRKLNRKDYELHFTAQLSEQDKPYFEKIKKVIKKSEKIFLHHDISSKELLTLYKKSRIFVYSSWSPYGYIFVESQAAGAPAIALGKGSGASEILVEDKTGFVVNSFDEIYEKIKLLIENPKLWNKMSKAGITNSKRFDYDTFRENFMKVIKEAIKRKPLKN